ncbi:MAG TPA: PPC domain-containing protein, partial [Blastocatellia bacterium]|nr:PPC domain-containing protein [Blastocatellia bacterium]
VAPNGAALRADSIQTDRRRRRQAITKERVSRFINNRRAAAATSAQSFGTGGGDIIELEPNDTIAQGVSLPVNIFGEISFNGDVDFFAFQALAGQQITIEPFAARLSNSDLIADIALFDSTGRLLVTDFGDEDDDPLIRFTPSRDEVLIAGIADVDDFGGPSFDYLLNITRGIDVEEAEPNGNLAQGLPGIPATIFGDIDGRTDVDFYSFVANAGQTLILDIDAEVIGSRLDAEINLLDPDSGVEFFYNDQNDGDDPRFNIVLPYTGRYVIGVGAFRENSSGFYRLNASLVPSAGAPELSLLLRLSGKKFEIRGIGFRAGTVVEVNGVPRKTTVINSGTLRAKAKLRAGDVVTIANSPDDRRSNPLIIQ